MDEEDYYEPDYDYDYDDETEDEGMNIKSAHKMLEDMSLQASGIGFVIMMTHGSGSDYSFHPRFDQPCQGGELRKYRETHLDECTQPHNSKPSDLHHPFPEGKPTSLAFHIFKGVKEGDVEEIFKAVVLSDTSPWYRGFGGEENIIPIIKSGRPHGFIIKRLNIDPTVMVNGLNFMKNVIRGTSFTQLRNEGLEPNEALLAMMMNGCGGDVRYLQQTYDYYFPTKVSVRRFLEGKPNDLTGGLLEDRADYNRTYVQDIFSCKKGLVWYKEMSAFLNGKINYGTMTLPEYVKAIKQFIAKGLEQEPEVIEEQYVYRDAVGIPKPYPEFALKINPSLAPAKKKEAA